MGLKLFKRKSSKIIEQTHFNNNINTTATTTTGEDKDGSSPKTSSQTVSSGKFSTIMTAAGSLNDQDLKQALATHSFEVPKVDLPAAPNPHTDPARYLRSINAVRERSNIVLRKALDNELNHFEVDLSKLDQTVKWVTSIIKVCPNFQPCQCTMYTDCFRFHSETTGQTTTIYLLTADGSTSMSVAALAWISS
jgi:hypothetical protein